MGEEAAARDIKYDLLNRGYNEGRLRKPSEVARDYNKSKRLVRAQDYAQKISDLVNANKSNNKAISGLLSAKEQDLTTIQRMQLKRVSNLAEEVGRNDIVAYNPDLLPDLYDESVKELADIIKMTNKGDKRLHSLILSLNISYEDIAVMIYNELVKTIGDKEYAQIGTVDLLDQIESVTDALIKIALQQKSKTSKPFFF